MKLKYVSIDIETTELDPEQNQIIEIAAIIDDLSNLKPVKDLPKFHYYIRHNTYSGSSMVLSWHTDKFKKISENGSDVIDSDNLFQAFSNWIRDNNGSINSRLCFERYDNFDIVVAGKNFGTFDKLFLEKNNDKFKKVFHKRCIDVGNMYLTADDVFPPSLDDCAKRAGLPMMVTHDAMNEAEMVVKLIRNYFNINIQESRDILF